MHDGAPAVLVVGAGPVGLAAALTLARHGVRPRLIDRLPAPMVQSRAAAVHARTLELLERLGVVGPFLEHGTRIHGVRLYGEQREQIGLVQLDGEDTPFPFTLGLGQMATERILAEALAEHGVAIERGVELVALEQGDTVTATLRHADGREERHQAAYLVGCDGGKSTVRRQLGLSLVGETLDQHWLTADCRADWNLPRDEAVAFLVPGGFAFAMAIEDDRWRLITPADPVLPPDRPATLADVQALCDRLLPLPVRLHDPVWVAQFALNTRLTATMQVGRVFLCGDAAHIHSPVGGQGMNTGIQDAINLGWKLALRLAGRCGQTLLDSYNAERHANARRMLSGVGPSTRLIALRRPVAVAVRNAVAHFVLQFDAVRHRLRQSVSELDVHYRSSPVVAEHHQPLGQWLRALTTGQPHPQLADCLAFGKGPHPGERAPDGEGLRTADSHEDRLFARWACDPRHQVLVFAGHAHADRRRQLAAMVTDLNARHAHLLNAALVTCANEACGAQELADPAGQVHHRYGARDECLYLVRPDGYVAFRSQPADATALDAFLQRILA